MNINATLFGQMITFGILVWFTMKFIWPPLTAAMDERQKKISEGLAAAERAEHDLAEAESFKQQEMRQAKAQAADIISAANKRGDELIEQKKLDAVAEGERMLEQARAKLEQERAAAAEALRSQVAELASAGASRILGKEIDAAAHSGLLDDLASQLGKA